MAWGGDYRPSEALLACLTQGETHTRDLECFRALFILFFVFTFNHSHKFVYPL